MSLCSLVGSPLLNSLNIIVKLTLLGIRSHKISRCIVSLWKWCSLALYFGIFIVYIKLRVNLLLHIPNFGQQMLWVLIQLPI